MSKIYETDIWNMYELSFLLCNLNHLVYTHILSNCWKSISSSAEQIISSLTSKTSDIFSKQRYLC